MATYQAYAEYKDSGVEWLEVIPSHWTSIAIKFDVTLFLERITVLPIIDSFAQ